MPSEIEISLPWIKHYKLKADEKRFFAHLPPNFPKAELDRAKRVYAGILTANYSGSVEKYLTPGDENQPWRDALNELVIFARSWWKTDAGKAIYFMLDLETSPKKNYFQEGWGLFEKEVELIKKEEEDERLTKKEEKLKKEKIEEVSRISEYIEKISNNSKLRSNAEKYTQIKKTKKALFLEEEKIVQNIKELKNTAPKNTEIIKIPGAENTMVKLVDLPNFAYQIAEFLWDTDPEKFEQALWENCRKGQFFENLSQELKEEHFCYIKTDKGEKLPEDKTKLAEVIRIYRKIQSQCWGAFVDCYFDKESGKWMAKVMKKFNLPHLIPERTKTRRIFFSKNNQLSIKERYEKEIREKIEYEERTNFRFDPVNFWEIIFLFQEVFPKDRLEENPLLQEDSGYELVEKIVTKRGKVIYNSILDNVYEIYWGGTPPLSRDEAFLWAARRRKYFFEKTDTEKIEKAMGKQPNKMIVALKTFWGIYHNEELMKIVNNVSISNIKRKQRVTNLEVEQNKLLCLKTSRVSKPEFENETNRKIKQKAKKITEEIVKEEKNEEIRNSLIKIVSDCELKKSFRITGRFWYLFVGKLGESRGRASEEEIKLLYNSYNSHLIIQGFTMESIYADFEIKSFDACHCLFKFDKKKNRELLVFTEEITTKQKQRTKLIQEIQKNINERKENINNYKENFQSLIPDAPEPKAPETTWTTLFWVGFLALIYFGWDKFWAWYEKPVKKEWDWDEEEKED